MWLKLDLDITIIFYQLVYENAFFIILLFCVCVCLPCLFNNIVKFLQELKFSFNVFLTYILGPGIKLLLLYALSHYPPRSAVIVVYSCLKKTTLSLSYCLGWEAVALPGVFLGLLAVGLGENCDLSIMQMTFSTAMEFYRCFSLRMWCQFWRDYY